MNEKPQPAAQLERENSNSIGFKSQTDSQLPQILSDFLDNEQSNEFLKSSLVNALTQKIAKQKRDLSQVESSLYEKDRQLLIKEGLISNLQHELRKRDEEIQNLNETIRLMESGAKKGRSALINALRALEEKKRQEIKTKLNNDSYRLGRVTMVRQGTRFTELWEDGKEISSSKEELSNNLKKKDALEKQRKQQRKCEDEEFLATLPLKLAILAREESSLKEKLERLEIEKAIHIQEWRRISEEDCATYCRATSEHEAWPVLHGRYLLLSLLGKGGYSEVYKAYDLLENHDIAIKFHQLNHNWAEAVKTNYIKHAFRENLILRELNHPRIVKHYNTLQIDNNCICTVLEFCPGEDLYMYLKRHRLLSEKEAKNIMQQIFAGLVYLNERPEKIIHYDLKPHNILLNNGEVKITDFGLSKIMEPSKTNMELTSQGVGTYWYQAPECFDTSGTPPRISSKVDVWSCGVLFFEMLYGIKPFGHNMTQEKVLNEKIIVNATSVNFPAKPSVSAECKELIRRCLEHNPDDRIEVIEAYSNAYFSKK